MSAGITPFACPTCRKLQSAPTSLAGQPMRCPYCQNVFLVPTYAPSPTPFAPVAHSAVVPPLARPVRPQPSVNATPQPATIEEPEEPAIPRSRLTPWLGVAFVGVLGLMLLLGTVVTIQYARGKLILPNRQLAEAELIKARSAHIVEPDESTTVDRQANEEMPVNDDAPVSIHDRNRRIIELAEKEKIAARNNGGAQVPSGPRTVQLDPKAIGRIKWENARDVSVVMHRVKVRVDRVEIGLVMGRDASNTVVPVGQRSYLSVFLLVQNQGDFPLEYHTWYREGGSSKTRHKPATIQDNLGNNYPIRTFQGFSRVRGVASTKKLIPGEEVQDVIVFEHPVGQMDEVKYFMLSLPASAYGSEGTYRFEIPLEMMKGW